MASIKLDPALLSNIEGKTVIITGAVGGIGREIVRLYASHGANVVIADLEPRRSVAEDLIAALPDPSRAIFAPANTLVWSEMTKMFKMAIKTFGSVEVVVANAGVMESHMTLDVEAVDQNGDLLEATEASKVIDINLKGTLSSKSPLPLRITFYHLHLLPALRLGLHYLKDNKERFPDGSRGSIILVISTSGYVGGTGVAAYVSSKHAVTGLLRSSQLVAAQHNIRVNAVAPFVTPTSMVAFAKQWIDSGLPSNTTQQVAKVIATLSQDPAMRGACYLVSISLFGPQELH